MGQGAEAESARGAENRTGIGGAEKGAAATAAGTGVGTGVGAHTLCEQPRKKDAQRETSGASFLRG